MGKVANINILLIIAYTVIEASPPYENRILFTNNTVRLTIACRTRVTDPKEEISFTIPNWILNHSFFTQTCSNKVSLITEKKKNI